MKYYSEITKQFYNTSAECEEAEAVKKRADEEAAAKKEAERRERENDEKHLEELWEAVKAAQKEYNKAATDFCDKYGTLKYHLSGDGWISLLEELF